MAVNVTTVLAGVNAFIATVEATADGDTVTGNIPHGLGDAPLLYGVTNLQQAAAQLSAWAVTTADATNLELTKDTAAGSGAAGDQVLVWALGPHSIIR